MPGSSCGPADGNRAQPRSSTNILSTVTMYGYCNERKVDPSSPERENVTTKINVCTKPIQTVSDMYSSALHPHSNANQTSAKVGANEDEVYSPDLREVRRLASLLKRKWWCNEFESYSVIKQPSVSKKTVSKFQEHVGSQLSSQQVEGISQSTYLSQTASQPSNIESLPQCIAEARVEVLKHACDLCLAATAVNDTILQRFMDDLPHLIEAGLPPSHTTLLVNMLIFPPCASLDRTPSRSLQQVLCILTEITPYAVVDGILVPLVSQHTSSPKIESTFRPFHIPILKACIAKFPKANIAQDTAMHMSEALLTQKLPLTEALCDVFTIVISACPCLTLQQLDSIVRLLITSAPQFEKSLKFAKLLLKLLQLETNTLREHHAASLTILINNNKTFLRRKLIETGVKRIESS